MSNNCQQYSAIKENIQKLIEQGKTEAAEAILCEYEGINPEDADIYSLRASILLSESKVDEAIALLDSVVGKYPFNFDLLYNLGFITEQSGRNQEALKWYREAQSLSKPEHETLLAEALIRLGNNATHFKAGNQKKLAVFVKQGLDSFLGDIIKSLSSEYVIKKIIVTNTKQVDEGMEWADICWFEWCDELIVHGSKSPLAATKYIICRLHRYEVFTIYPSQVSWHNVNKLIVVTSHLVQLLKMSIPDICERVTVVTVNNGVNLEEFPFCERKSGFNIAYIGYLHLRKNPILLLQIMKMLVNLNPLYKLHVAGVFQDDLTRIYWNYQVQELELQKNILFDGWQDDVGEWLKDKEYVISTSIHESFGYGIAEAMARGIKPIIHNFPYAKEIWHEQYLFNTAQEAIEMITADSYQSEMYRQYIEENYSLTRQIDAIKEILGHVGSNSRTMNNLDTVISATQDFFLHSPQELMEYDWKKAKIQIGKRERMQGGKELFEYILINSKKKNLILTGIIYSHSTKEWSFPNIVDASLYLEKIRYFAEQMLNYKDIVYNNNIAGFVFDRALAQDIQHNQLAYLWERAIPATQFMPLIGYYQIANRYRFIKRYLNPKDVVLDAAAGYGYGTAFLSDYCKRIYGLDIALDNIKFANNSFVRDNLSFMEGNVTSLPFPEDLFDTYISFETIEHLLDSDVSLYLEEVLKVIKPNGLFIVSTPNREMRMHINNPYHIREYTFVEINNILSVFFRNIEYHSVVGLEVREGIDKRASNIIAICHNRIEGT
ncbi:methyltransferase domain-containing protein [Desulfosporosinus fructosivorans]|uniref:Methyltransferase domain-containing protein n=1 Tax=Desulfosporosinus fructosivorans TaxID=2018669 RepID=A0A4Z0R9Y6_9FIRM|nr:methyltransferase domain-containing protein [Desulfosporosinus fructosivorans]TGE39972.1 methyltransferase domain-containing protein [Desulfosporosinus fructosivorans]